MRRSVLHRLVVTTVMAAVLGGLATPAVAATRADQGARRGADQGRGVHARCRPPPGQEALFLVRLPAGAQLQTGSQAPDTPSPDTLDADLFTATLGHWWLTTGSVPR